MKKFIQTSFKKSFGVCAGVVVSLSAITSSAATLTCTGLWAGVESIMPVTAVVTTAADGAPAPFKIVVNNAEFRGSMMPAGAGLYGFNVRRVGADMVLTGNLRFLTTISEPAKTGFSLHTSDGRIEAILTCDSAR